MTHFQGYNLCSTTVTHAARRSNPRQSLFQENLIWYFSWKTSHRQCDSMAEEWAVIAILAGTGAEWEWKKERSAVRMTLDSKCAKRTAFIFRGGEARLTQRLLEIEWPPFWTSLITMMIDRRQCGVWVKASVVCFTFRDFRLSSENKVVLKNRGLFNLHKLRHTWTLRVHLTWNMCCNSPMCAKCLVPAQRLGTTRKWWGLAARPNHRCTRLNFATLDGQTDRQTGSWILYRAHWWSWFCNLTNWRWF